MKYLLGGSVALAMYMAVMSGGGMRYIARGVHGGYLITRITPVELVVGLNLAGVINASARSKSGCAPGVTKML